MSELAKVCPSARGELTAYTTDMARLVLRGSIPAKSDSPEVAP